MKKFLLATAGLVILGVASASAADLPRQMPTKAPAYVPPPLYNWTGLYIGINGGGAFGNSEFSAPFASGSFDVSGGLVGGTLGYNYQVGQVVFGLEGDIDWASISGSSTCGVGFSCETRNDWLATIRGRLGYAGWDRFMPYITGGAAFGNIKTEVAGIGSSDETKTGWTLGGGIEGVIAGPWTAKIEYLYVDLGSGGSILGSDADFQTSIVRAGLNYRF